MHVLITILFPTASGSDGEMYIFRDKRGKGVRMSNDLRVLMSA